MSPADIIIRWPSADEIARSLVAACRIEGDDPIDVFKGEQAPRSRVYALLALAHEYPTTPRRWLGRALGDERVQPKVLMTINRQASQWFVLERLNDVRAACGWSPMTMEDVLAAPLLYCGRRRNEFVAKPAADACAAQIEVGDEPAPDADAPETSPLDAEAGSAVELGASDGCDADAAPAEMLEQARERSESRKAWLRGEPPAVAEVEAPLPLVKTAPVPALVADAPVSGISPSDEVEKPEVAEPLDLPPLADFTRRPEPQATAAVADLQAAFGQPEALTEAPKATSSPSPKVPTPLTPSPAAVALAGALQARTPAPAPRGAENVGADVRRPQSDLSTFRAAELGRGVVSYRRADAPAEKRGMVVVTSEFCGDRPPSRLRTDQIDAMARGTRR